jgi:hypothetical protein
VHLTVKCGVGRMCVCVVEGGWVGGGGEKGDRPSRDVHTRNVNNNKRNSQK